MTATNTPLDPQSGDYYEAHAADLGMSRAEFNVSTEFLSNLVPGQRVELLRDVERFPHFIAKRGLRGTIDEVEGDQIAVKMDETLAGAEEWENCIHWYFEALLYVNVEFAVLGYTVEGPDAREPVAGERVRLVRPLEIDRTDLLRPNLREPLEGTVDPITGDVFSVTFDKHVPALDEFENSAVVTEADDPDASAVAGNARQAFWHHFAPLS